MSPKKSVSLRERLVHHNVLEYGINRAVYVFKRWCPRWEGTAGMIRVTVMHSVIDLNRKR